MDVMKSKKTSLLRRLCYCTALYQVSFSYLQYWRLYGGGAQSAPPVLQGSKKPGINRVNEGGLGVSRVAGLANFGPWVLGFTFK